MMIQTSRQLMRLQPTAAVQNQMVTARGVAGPALQQQEALDHVNHRLRQVPRLDRERKVGRKMSYRVVGPPDLALVHGLLYSSYHPDEPITRYLGLCKGLNSIPDADRLVEHILAKHLTVLAEDEMGRPVGVTVNNVCSVGNLTPEHHEEELEKVIDPSYRPLLAVRQQLRLSNLHIYEELGVDKFFSIRMVGVEPGSRGQGVATDLIRRSVLLAGCLGYRGINSVATGTFARGAFQAIGMLPTNSIKYSEFTYKGEKVLEGVPKMPAGEQEITFLRKKFFQSALKHIL